MLLVLCGSGLKGLGLEGTVVYSLPLAFLEASAPVHNPVLVSGIPQEIRQQKSLKDSGFLYMAGMGDKALNFSLLSLE